MTITSSLRARATKAEADATAAYWRHARAIADGTAPDRPTTADVRELEEALRLLGRDADEFDSDVEAIRQLRRRAIELPQRLRDAEAAEARLPALWAAVTETQQRAEAAAKEAAAAVHAANSAGATVPRMLDRARRDFDDRSIEQRLLNRGYPLTPAETVRIDAEPSSFAIVSTGPGLQRFRVLRDMTLHLEGKPIILSQGQLVSTRQRGVLDGAGDLQRIAHDADIGIGTEPVLDLDSYPASATAAHTAHGDEPRAYDQPDTSTDEGDDE